MRPARMTVWDLARASSFWLPVEMKQVMCTCSSDPAAELYWKYMALKAYSF